LIVMRHFAQWLTKSGLHVNRIYSIHGRGYATMEHVRRVLAIR
jgi:hypothetical protein